MKKTYFLLLFLAVTSVAYFSCNDEDDTELLGNWVISSEFDGDARSGAVSFTIGDSAYIGFGMNDDDDYLYDLWRFTVSDENPTGSWTQRASLQDTAHMYGRIAAVAFSVGTKAYVGTGYGYGYDGATFVNENYMNDFWEYDSQTNTWKQAASLPGDARRGAIAFSINGKGYVGTGANGSGRMKDFYVYDPNTSSWAKMSDLNQSFPGGKREFASCFVINNKAYIVGGYGSTLVYDFYYFNADSGTWVKKRPLANSDDTYDDNYTILRQQGVGFALQGKGYITLGMNSSYKTRTVWEYNPADDLWTEKTSFEKDARIQPVAFTIKNRAFVATGTTSGNGTGSLEDVYEFKPFALYENND
jgi:N-acetylneuraminic acid mutarotase